MTTATPTAIVPAMSTTGVSLWTPHGPRIVGDVGTPDDGPQRPTRPTPGTVGTHGSPGSTVPEGVGTHSLDLPGDVGTHSSGTADHVGTHVGTHDDAATSPGSPSSGDVGTHSSDHVGTPDDDTRGDTRMRVTEAQRTTVTGLGSKAEQIRYICEQLGHPETSEVHAWLDACEVTASRKYVSRIVNTWRDERGLTDTGGFRALTADVLTELDAQHQPTDDEDQEETAEPQPPAEPPDEPQATAELAARVREARARLPLQADPSLLTALSDEEIRAERDLAEWERATDREIRRAAKKAELANAKRAQDTATALSKAESDDARWHQRALSMRKRLTSPDARLAQLYRRAEWSSRALITVMLLAMAWSGINVQHNLVPDGDMSKLLYWVSYGLEATISVPLIVIMVAATTAARWGRQLSRKKVIPIELTLLAVTVGLNAGPHLFSDPSKSAEYAIAPVMVGAVVWLHAWISHHYATLIEGSNVIGDRQ